MRAGEAGGRLDETPEAQFADPWLRENATVLFPKSANVFPCLELTQMNEVLFSLL